MDIVVEVVQEIIPQNISLYVNKFNYLLSNTTSVKPTESDKRLMSWLFEHLFALNPRINLFDLYILSGEKLDFIIKVLLILKEYDILSKCLIVQSEQANNPSILYEINNKFVSKLLLQERKESSKVDVSIFYFWLFYKVRLGKDTISTLKKLKLENVVPSNFQ